MPRTVTKSSPKTKTVPYDVSEQLRTPEEMAAYLDAWFAEAPDDAVGIARALGDIARAKGMTQVARDAGLSRESLYKALGENGNPSFATVLKVARARSVCVCMHSRPELRSSGIAGRPNPAVNSGASPLHGSRRLLLRLADRGRLSERGLRLSATYS